MDKRLTKTREGTLKAVFQLMVAKPWDSISVREICTAAKISRSAFYKQFMNKDAILAETFSSLAESLSGTQNNRGLDKNGTLRCLKPLLSHVHSHQAILIMNSGSSGWGNILAQFKKVITTAIKSEIADLPHLAILDDVDIAFLSGGIAEAISIWCENNLLESEEVMLSKLDALVAKLFEPVSPRDISAQRVLQQHF